MWIISVKLKPHEKKECAILVGDQVSGRNILTDLVGVENSQNATRSLKYIKDVLHLNPDIIVHDLSPNLIKATTDVFGYDKVAFDPFHVMQALNRAIAKDLKSYRLSNFNTERNEILNLRDNISKFISDFREHAKFKKPFRLGIANIDSNHLVSKKCKIFAQKVLNLCNIDKETQFMTELTDFLNNIYDKSDANELKFAQSIEKILPKRALTKKGHNRLVLELLKKLKSYFLLLRKPIEEKQKKFSKNRHIIFFQPENITDERSKLLSGFLKEYPELEIYRALTLRIGSIYRLPPDEIMDSVLTDLKIHDEYGDELKSCLKTFKQHYQAILRFRDFFLKNPEMPRRSRANMEFNNRPVKTIFRSGLNCKSIKRIQNELKIHLGGEVRNFIKSFK